MIRLQVEHEIVFLLGAVDFAAVGTHHLKAADKTSGCCFANEIKGRNTEPFYQHYLYYSFTVETR